MSRETALNDAGHTVKTQIKQRRTNARLLSMLISPATTRSREFFSTRHFMARLTSRNKSRFVLVKRDHGDAAVYVFKVTPAGGEGGGAAGVGGGGTPHMKGVGMLVVSLRGVNLTYAVLGKTPPYLAVKVSFRVARKKI